VYQEAEYRELVEYFVAWCGNNRLILKMKKSKKIVVDFKGSKPNTVYILDGGGGSLQIPVCLPGQTRLEMQY